MLVLMNKSYKYEMLLEFFLLDFMEISEIIESNFSKQLLEFCLLFDSVYSTN